MKASTRALLEEAIAYGKRNSGCGYSTASLIQKALDNEDVPVIEESYLTPAIDGCDCICHMQPGVIHFVACCGTGSLRVKQNDV